MEGIQTDQLITLLSKCRHLINKGCSNLTKLNVSPCSSFFVSQFLCYSYILLQNFCLEFLKLSEELHRFLSLINDQHSQQVEIIHLILTQILTCVKNMERTIKVEEAQGMIIQVGEQ